MSDGHMRRDPMEHGWTEQAVLARIEAAVRKHGSLRKAALSLGVSVAFLSDIRHGRREAGPKLLKALKLRKRVRITREVRYFPEVWEALQRYVKAAHTATEQEGADG